MSIEINDVRARWQNQRQALLRADFNQADEELARVLYFADHHPIISSVLRSLRLNPVYQKFEAESWIKGRGRAGTNDSGRTNLGFSLDEIERCAQSLKVLEWAVTKFNDGSDGLWPIGKTTYVGSSSTFIDSIHSAIENLFNPLYSYIDTELRNLETLITPVDIVRDIQSFVDNDASLRYHETHKLLTDAYKQMYNLTSNSSGTSWYQIGYSCRSVLVKFGNEVFNSTYVPEGQEQPKEDDASNKLKWAARFFLKSTETGDRYRECIEKIIQANWNYVSNIGHREDSVTENDARLALIYTYLTIFMIDHLITS